MAVHYSIQELGDALEIRVRNEISMFLRVTCGGFAGWIVWFWIGAHLPSVSRAGLAIVIGVLVLALFRRLTAQLIITNTELFIGKPRGRVGEGALQATRIYRLEYQEHESGGEGIYAVTATGEPVVLPHVDAAQAQEIIAAIKKKFPGLAEMWMKSESAALWK